MKADAYELEHMHLDGPVRFRDRQRARRIVISLLGPAAFVALMVAFDLDLATTAVMSGVALLAGLLALVNSSYRVIVTDRSLNVQCGLSTRRIPFAAIMDVSVAPRRAFDTLVGTGVLRFSVDRSVERYAANGLDETVRIIWRIGERTRTTIIATDRASELAHEITRGIMPRVRVDTRDVAFDLEDECSDQHTPGKMRQRTRSRS